MTALVSYSTGTVTVSAGGTTVTGTGTIWSGVNVRPGDILQIGNFQTIISDVVDIDELTIPPWGGGAQTGAAYKIWQWFPQRVAGAEVAQTVNKLVAALNKEGFYWFVDADETEPDPSLGNDGQYASQPITGKLWIKAAGVWDFLGVYKGFNFTGDYSGATTYSLGDVQTTSGTSYVWINPTPGSGHTAPNATYWQVLASKGDTGNTGPTGAGYGGTSTTSLTIGTGSKVFTTQSGLAYQDGARVRATATAGATGWLEGVATYGGTTLTITGDKTSGSGTGTAWNFNVVGEPGAGDLSSANNLSDLANAATAAANLGVVRYGGSQSLTAAQKAQVAANIQQASLAKSASYTVVANDFGALIKLTSSGTLSLTAAAALGDGFECHLTNTGAGVWTIDPNSSELVDGATTIRLSPKQSCTLRCDGTGFYTCGLAKRTLLQSVVASNSATVDLTCYSGYDYHEIEAFGVAPATDNVDLQMRISSDNGASYDAGTDQYVSEVIAANGTGLSALTHSTTGWYLAASQDVTGVVAGQFDCMLFPGDGVRRPSAKGEFGFFTNTPGNLGIRKFFGFRQDLVVTTNVRFVYSSGNIAAGTFVIYGVQVS
ncbi:hypothetical protein EDE08_109350 [Bradyrhizobium sp. R2.2-H]|jgi:hypothetical protein|uniref:hypothetical protein n=1 Tax=unclassified Bradyrhizobium TaxID=2631580 RepID=UPI0010EFBD45|nr:MULTISPECIES: hypothetical protein [unclassified Bradyrhizobium]TCU68253.1 hypothetical protein EDE10_10963 [Bradyrhizobium sp. Y-H1]TCU70125.1 hypothetical protein EDE08_109350 [Bradyrhizobium sp. R2.2-H]